jgi:glycosyltransferase involved in cell wall biosynthesis
MNQHFEYSEPASPRILAFAYACYPDRGSEPGAGWNLARMLARIGDTVVLTTPLGRAAIESVLPTMPERASLRFVYVDVPLRSGLKPRPRHDRLNYLLWQCAALKQAWNLQREQRFDLVWHLTIASVWFGSVASLVGPTYIYGPVGGGTQPPWRLVPALGLQGALYEAARTTVHLLQRYLNPLARVSLRRAYLILVQNQQTLERLPRRLRGKAQIFSNAIGPYPLPRVSRESGQHPTAVYAGELRAFKGACFAIRALATRPEWRLLICGTGPDERRLRRLATRLGVAERVSFLGWLPRSGILRLMRDEAHVLVFPSLHDEAGAAVVEALSHGLAVICIDQGGPVALAGPAARTLPTRGSSRRFVDRLAANLRPTTDGERANAYSRAQELSLETRASELARILRERSLIVADGARHLSDTGTEVVDSPTTNGIC